MEQEISTNGQRNTGQSQNSTRETIHKISFLDKKAIENIHRDVIARTHEKVPERANILNQSMFDFALEAPQMTLFGYDVYPTLFEKVAVLARAIIRGHAFEAGNKRTGFICAETFLRMNGYDLVTDDTEAEEITTKIAQDTVSLCEIADWLRNHSKKR